MIRRIYILATMSLLVIGCSKVEHEDVTTQSEGVEPGCEVTFTLDYAEVDWTRGTSIDNAAMISTVGIYAVRNSDDFSYDSDVKTLYIDNTSATKLSDYTWHFSPSLYYPYGEALKVFAYSPYDDSTTSGVTTSFDLDNETMSIVHVVPAIDARDQPDLLVATAIGNSDNNGSLEFDYTHALTKITLSARFTEYTSPTKVTNEDGELVDPEYYIVGFTLGNIATTGTLTCSASGEGVIGFGSDSDYGWSVDSSTRKSIITSNAYALPDPTGHYSSTNDAVQLTDEFENIMVDQALFMLPQSVAATSSIDGGSSSGGSTITIEIYEKVEGKYYSSAEFSLPTPDIDGDGTGDGLLIGQHINLQYAFTVDPYGEVIEVSLTPTMVDWYEFDVLTDIDPNIYMLLEAENIESSGSTATVTLYTNSAVTPEVTSDTFTISSIAGTASGETPGAHTIEDATLTAYTITIDTSDLSSGATTGVISVTAYSDAFNSDAETAAGKPDETYIIKEFNLTITK